MLFAAPRVSFETSPDRYRHWRLSVEGPVARLAMDVQEEGCLSLPGITVAVRRHRDVTVWSDGREHQLTGEIARVAQHEIDHLDGVLIIDRGNPV